MQIQAFGLCCTWSWLSHRPNRSHCSGYLLWQTLKVPIEKRGKKKNPLSPQSNHSFLKFMCLNRENELGAFFLYVYEIKLLNKKGAGIAAKDGSKNKQGTSSHRASHCMSGDWLRLLFVCASRLVRQSLFSPALWFTLLVTLASAPLGWTTTAGQQGAGAPGQISHLEHRACQRHFNVTPVLA